MSDRKETVKANKKEEKKENKFIGFFQKTWKSLVRRCRDLKGEIKSIVWPTPKQTLNNTLVVIVMVAIIGAFVAVLDLLYSSGVRLLVG